MIKTITIINQNQENVSDYFNQSASTDFLFRELQKDTIGKSGANPIWGYVYTKQGENWKYKGIALHKEYDYDLPEGAYAEKIWDVFGKEILSDLAVRVPEVDIVEQEHHHPEVISYRLIDNDKEDMIHIRDTLYNKLNREQIKKFIFTFDQILECVQLQIQDPENFEKVKEGMIQTFLLDSITNNGDRHVLNWALVRNKETNYYELAVFDHVGTFTGMLEQSPSVTLNGWVGGFTTVGIDQGRTDIGSNGEKIVQYINQAYPESFRHFMKKWKEKLPDILKKVEMLNLPVDLKRLENKIREKNRFMKELINEGELEYE